MSKYKPGDKFVIEIDEQVGNLYKIKGFNTLVFDDFGLDRLGQLVQGVDQYSRCLGQREAWELVCKLFDMEQKGHIEMAFDGQHSNVYSVLGWNTYKEAAQRVVNWEKVTEVQIGDIFELDKICRIIVTDTLDGLEVAGLDQSRTPVCVTTNDLRRNWKKIGHADFTRIIQYAISHE